jgi:hypothetical protein
MMSCQDSIAQVIEAFVASLALVTLAEGLSLIESPLHDSLGLAPRASDTKRPSQLAQDFKTLGIINQRLKVHQRGIGHGLEYVLRLEFKVL